MKRFLINLWRQNRRPDYCRKCEQYTRVPWRDGSWVCWFCDLI